MSPTPPKYSLPEIERRWLVDRTLVPALDELPWRQIDDKYIERGRLRLRTMRSSDGDVIYKFGKKYPSPAGKFEQIVNIYLTPAEFDVLSNLPGVSVTKRRYLIQGGALDVYADSPQSPLIFEREFASAAEAAAFTPPNFVTLEVTGNSQYSGFALAGAN
jgi:CYTH domain-containing protein